MRQDTKSLILQGAFKLFLTENFNKVTVYDLEKETGFTRGTIFYHFNSLESIFHTVIDKYFLSIEKIDKKLSRKTLPVLKAFISEYVSGIEATMKKLLSITDNKAVSYYHIISQAYIYYPDFSIHVKEIFEKELDSWKSVIQKAVSNKEIKNINVDTIAKRFRYIYVGLSYEMGLTSPKGLDPNALKKMFMSLYEDIKI